MSNPPVFHENCRSQVELRALTITSALGDGTTIASDREAQRE